MQVSSAKPLVKVDTGTLAQVEEALKAAGIAADLVTLDGASIKARFANTDAQLKAKDAIQKALIPDAGQPGLCGGAESVVALAGLAVCACMRRPCTWGWTCAVACTSCCRWTCRRR